MLNRVVILLGLALALYWIWSRMRPSGGAPAPDRACPDCNRPLRRVEAGFEHAKATWECLACGYREHELR